MHWLRTLSRLLPSPLLFLISHFLCDFFSPFLFRLLLPLCPLSSQIPFFFCPLMANTLLYFSSDLFFTLVKMKQKLTEKKYLNSFKEENLLYKKVNNDSSLKSSINANIHKWKYERKEQLHDFKATPHKILGNDTGKLNLQQRNLATSTWIKPPEPDITANEKPWDKAKLRNTLLYDLSAPFNRAKATE